MAYEAPWEKDWREQTGIEKLRRVVNIMNNCRESFNDRFTPSQLIKLCDMMIASGWDITPDEWEERQVNEALEGKPPQFDGATELPIYND